VIRMMIMNFKKFFQRWKRLLGMIGSFVFAIIAIIVIDSARRAIIGDNFKGNIVIEGNFKNNLIPPENTVSGSEISSPDSSIENITAGFSETTLNNTENLGKGSLVLINSEYPAKDSYSGLCNLESGKGYMVYNSENASVSPEVPEHLRDMIDDYCLNTGKNNVVIYNTAYLNNEENSLYETDYPESVSGYSLDIAINSSYSEIIQYDGFDVEGWLAENCYNYGFIIRFPENKEEITGFEYSPYHFRYVGLPHSLIMNEKNMCLEEYTDFIKDYTSDNPLSYNSGDHEYTIYYTPAENTETTTIRIPENAEYQISGNNYDGYIISYCLSAPETP